eukprot:761462-Hanusia_phi.AAC.3
MEERGDFWQGDRDLANVHTPSALTSELDGDRCGGRGGHGAEGLDCGALASSPPPSSYLHARASIG